MENRVVVTGLGVVSAVGNEIPAFWHSLREGKSGVGPLMTFDASQFDSRIAGEVKGFNPALYGLSTKDNLCARHKALASPPIILVEHNLSVRTYPALIFITPSSV